MAFDRDARQVLGGPVPLVEEVADEGSGAAQFDVAEAGSLVYLGDTNSSASDYRDEFGGALLLVWVDRQGRATPVVNTPGSYLRPRLSPDGSRIAVTLGVGREGDLWTVDIDSGRSTRLTLDAQDNRRSVWSPDGTRRSGEGALYWKSADALDEPELLVQESVRMQAGSWSPDGRTLAFYKLTINQGRDIWTVEIGEKPRPFLTTSFNERTPTFSPDGI